MSQFNVLVFFFVAVIINQILSLQENYYWREYTGNVPADAVTGGQDINGVDTYIGQAFVKDQGLMVAQIYPGIKEVYVPIYGVKKIDSSIKILCGPQENFYWIVGNKSHLHLTLIDKHAVIGGFEGTNQQNIGRISHEGEIKIGKVFGATFYFNDKGTEKQLPSYEILMYNKTYNIDARSGQFPSCVF